EQDGDAVAVSEEGETSTADGGVVEWLKAQADLGKDAFVNQLIDDVRSQIGIGDKKIPVLYFKGSLGRLAEIFERMKDNVLPLAKYEIFAAAWERHKVALPVSEKEVREFLIERYTAFEEDTGVSVEHFDPEDASLEDISLFEFLYGFSHKLATRF